jgi:hypothetical protein
VRAALDCKLRFIGGAPGLRLANGPGKIFDMQATSEIRPPQSSGRSKGRSRRGQGGSRQGQGGGGESRGQQNPLSSKLRITVYKASSFALKSESGKALILPETWAEFLKVILHPTILHNRICILKPVEFQFLEFPYFENEK